MTIDEFKAKHGHTGALATADEIIRAKVNADRQKKGEDYCVLCAEGLMPISGMRLITSEEDPYIQLDSARPVRACASCFEEHYPDSEVNP
jgi:hypothetical protein